MPFDIMTPMVSTIDLLLELALVKPLDVLRCAKARHQRDPVHCDDGVPGQSRSADLSFFRFRRERVGSDRAVRARRALCPASQCKSRARGWAFGVRSSRIFRTGATNGSGAVPCRCVDGSSSRARIRSSPVLAAVRPLLGLTDVTLRSTMPGIRTAIAPRARWNARLRPGWAEKFWPSARSRRSLREDPTLIFRRAVLSTQSSRARRYTLFSFRIDLRRLPIARGSMKDEIPAIHSQITFLPLYFTFGKIPLRFCVPPF